MKTLYLSVAIAALGALSACSGADVEAASADTKAAAQSSTQVVEKTAVKAAEATATGADIKTAPSGTYAGDATHTYVGFTYMHQGFARATLRADNVQTAVNFDAENPEKSTLKVTIDPNDIHSGVKAFDEHLMGEDFFDVANNPEITFVSTNLTLATPSTGTVTGDLTMNGITKSVTLDVTLNKVGQNFRSQADMIGVSARGKVDRGDWDMGLYAPAVGSEVDLVIEAELVKTAAEE